MNNWCICWFFMHSLNAELNPICHLLALLGGATIVVVSRLRVKEIKAGVPQGSVLGSILYLLYTSDIPELGNSTVTTFADDTAILAVGTSNEESTGKLQTAIN